MSVSEEQQHQPPTLAEVTAAPVGEPTKSIAERLRASATEAREHKTRDFRIPDYDELWVTFRALADYKEVRGRLKDVVRRRGVPAADREVEIALETLALASVSSYAIVDGERVEIGLPLGGALYDYIWPATEENQVRPGNDREAIVALFAGNTVQIASMAAQLDRWFQDTGREADDELLGE